MKVLMAVLLIMLTGCAGPPPKIETHRVGGGTVRDVWCRQASCFVIFEHGDKSVETIKLTSDPPPLWKGQVVASLEYRCEVLRLLRTCKVVFVKRKED